MIDHIIFTRHADKIARDHSRLAKSAIEAAERLSNTDPRFSVPRSISELSDMLSATYAELDPGDISVGMYQPHPGEFD